MFQKILNTFSTKIITAIVNFLLIVVLSQVIGASGKGTASLILATIHLIQIFSSFMGGSALVYLVPRHSLLSLIFPAYVWSFFISFLAYFIMLHDIGISSIYAFHVACIAFVVSVYNINLGVLIAKKAIIRNNSIALLQTLMNLATLLVLFFIYENKEVFSYVYALYFSFGLGMILSFVSLKKYFLPQDFKYNSKTLKPLIRYGFLNQVAHICQFLSFRLGYYFLEFYHGEALVGIYSNGASIAESIWLISRSISLVQFSEIVNSKDKLENQKLTLKLSKASWLVSAILLAGLLILPESFYILIFGKEFVGIKTVLFCLAPGILFLTFNFIISHYFGGTGQYQINALVSGIGLVISLILAFVLIPKYDLIGTGLTASISYLATSFAVIWIFKQQSNFSWKDFFRR